MELEQNQAALILETSGDGEVSVNVASADSSGLAAALCRAIAHKLMNDEQFQVELMEIVEAEEND